MNQIGTSVRRSSRLVFGRLTGNDISGHYCQTLGLVLRLRVDFVLPLSQQEEEQEEEEQEQPLTKIYQKGVY